MSTTIDQKVVEMRFDNKQFEAGVSTTMSTLDKFKQKLNLTGASKGLDEINASAKRVDMSGLGKAAETVSAKFSAMQVMGVTALANITNSAVNTGKRLLAAFTIDPPKTGFNEYELKMGSVQTIMASTGAKLEDVNRYLKELNDYSDKTIYSFADMTNNIGKFTNAGVKLEDAVLAIKGISNEAAVSGANANEASRAMYNFSQALSAGYVKLIDWKSIENANMATVEFKKQLLESAVACGTLTRAGDEMYNTGKRTISATLNFNDSLTDQWMTTEVLTRTLAQYATDVRELSDAEREAYEEKLRGQGYTDEQIKKIEELGKKAYDSAQDVKTFSMMMDTLKEAAQSGWAQTWELLFGDFEQAKELWTSLSNFFGNIIDGMSKARNDLLQSALGKTFTSLAEKINGITDPIKKSADSIKEVTKTVADYEKVVNEIIRGGIWGTGQARWDKLTEAGYDWAHAQNLVNEKLGNAKRHATNYKAAQEEVIDTTGETIEIDKEYIKKLAKMSEEELRAAKCSEPQIEALNELKKTAEKLGMPLNEFIDNLDKIDGRWLVLESFKNIGQSLVNVFKAVGKAWRETFYENATDDAILQKKADGVFSLIAAFHKLTNKLYITEGDAEKLTRVFKGLFSIIDLITTFLGGGFKLAFKILSKVLSAFNLDVLEFAAIIGDALVKFRDWVLENNFVVKSINKLIEKLPEAIKAVKEWFDAFKQLPWVQNLITKFQNGFGGLKDIGKNFIQGFIDGVSSAYEKIPKFLIDICKKILSLFAINLGEHSPSVFTFEDGVNFIQGFINGIKETVKKVYELIKGIGFKIVEAFRNIPFDKAFSSIEGFFSTIVDYIKKIPWDKVFAFAFSVTMILFIKKVGDAIAGIGHAFESFGDILENVAAIEKSFSKVLNGIAWDFKAKALQKLAISLAIMVGLVLLIVKVGGDDYKKLWNAVGVIGALAVILGVLAYAMGKMSAVSAKYEKGKGFSVDGLKAGLLGIGLAILALGATVKLMGSMKSEELIQGFLGLVGILVALSLVFLAYGKLVKGDAAYNMDLAGQMIFKLSISVLLLVWVCKLIAKLSPEEMLKGATFVTFFTLFVLALTATSKLAGNGIDKLGGMMIKMTIAMGLLVIVTKMISKLSAGQMVKGLAFAAGFSLFIKMLVWAIKAEEKNIPKLGGLILSISISMMLMVGVMKLVNTLSVKEIVVGVAFVALFLVFVKKLVSTLTISSEQQIAKVAGTILAISLAIAILAAVSIVLSLISIPGLIKGIAAVGALGAIISLMVIATKDAKNVKGSIMAMAIAIGIMAASIALLSFIDPKKLVGPTLCMAALIGMFALLVKTSNYAKKVKPASLGVMVGAVAVLAIAIWMLSTIENPKNALINIVALSALMLSFAGFIRIIDKVDVGVKKAIATFVTLGLLAGAMYLFVLVLKQVKGIDNIITNVIAISGLMAAMAGVLKILSTIDWKKAGNMAVGILALSAMWIPMYLLINTLKQMNGLENAIGKVVVISSLMLAMSGVLKILSTIDWKKAGNMAAGIVALSLLVAPMLVFVFVLNQMTGLENAIGKVAVISALMLAMSGVVTILSKIKFNNIESLLSPILALFLLAAPMLAFVFVLNQMNGVQNAITNVIAISGLMAAMAGVLMILSNLKNYNIVDLAVSIGALAALVLPMLAFVEVLKQMNGIQNGITNAIALSVLMIAMSVVIGILCTLHVGLASAAAAAAGFDAFIVIIGGLVVALGALADEIGPLIDKGIPILVKLASGLGEMIGAFVGGMIGGLTEALPIIGENLTEFANALNKGFIENIKKVDGQVLDAALIMVAVIVALTAAELLSGISKLIGLFTGGMDGLEDSLVSFAKIMVKFSKTITEDGGVDAAAIESTAKAGLMLAQLQNSLAASGGLLQGLLGEKDLEDFGKSCLAFGKLIIEFSKYIVENGGVDEKAVEAAVKAGTLMSELQNSLPKSGGWVQSILGEQDLVKFGASCVAFGESIVAFSDCVAANGGVDSKAIEAAVNGGTLLAELEKSIPKSGGWIQTIAGEGDLQTFGLRCVAFGEAIAEFSQTVSTNGGVNVNAVTQAKIAGEVLAELQSILPNTGGLLQKFAGQADIEKFATGCKTFAEAITALPTDLRIDQSVFTTIEDVGKAMVALQETLPDKEWFKEKMDFAEFGTGCESFAGAIQKLSGITAIPESVITSIADAGTAFTAIAEAIPSTGWLSGKMDLAEFGTCAAKFTTAIGSIEKISINPFSIAMIQMAGTAFTEIANAIPKTGWLSGKMDLGEFAGCITTFSDAIAKLQYVKVDPVTVNNIVTTGKSLTELQKSIPTDKWFDGKISLDDFGTKIKKFGSCLSEYSKKASEISFTYIDSSISRANDIADFANRLNTFDSSGIDKFKNIKDIGAAINNYYKKVKDIDASIVKSSISSVDTLSDAFKKLNGVKTAEVISSFSIEGLGTKLKSYYDSISGIDTSAIAESIGNLTRLRALIETLAGLDTSGVTSFKNAVYSLGKTQVGDIVGTFTSAIGQLQSVGSDLANAVANGMRSKQGAIKETASGAIKGAVSQIKGNSASFQSAAAELMTKFSSGISKQKESVNKTFTSIASSGVTSIKNKYDSFHSAGSYLVDGFSSGISQNAFKATAKAVAMAEAALEAAEEALGIESPSKEFYKVGDYTGQGFVNALTDYKSKSYDASYTMADYARKGLSNAISKIQKVVDMDGDYQPTIRPVLDLTDVEAGASVISSLFSGGTTIGMSAKVDSISSMMNNRNQNGGTGDVVSAIDSLRKDLGKVGGTTYNSINGINYNDDAEISNAIQTIVRAAKMERRA